MRVSVLATALCLSLLPLLAALAGRYAGAATTTTDARPNAAAPITPIAPAAVAPAAVAPAAPLNDVPDAAAKHAKRTGCLKEARAKKLVGAARTAYVKSCIASP